MTEHAMPVEASSVLRPGMPLIIKYIDKKGDEWDFKSTIHDINFERGIMKIGMPSYKGRFVPIAAGEPIHVTAVAEKVVYTFDSRVINYGRDEQNFLVMYIAFPRTVKRVQRRRYVRIPLVLEGTFKIPGQEEVYRFVTKDFSAGGILMCTKQLLQVGQPILITLDLGSIKLEDQKAQVVRYVGKNDVTGLHEYGVQFLEVPPQLEKALVVYVFQQELKMRKASGRED
ncbi:flagellar brake protein [Pseudothermotoga thermarum]|uniref:Type IV pilus assembly PilZ n=1 Tax=Pseudothermotoga thermarum DSM 5069 TaxID=688269 RepID=F7YXY9_9THEM|nr:PilZ domain-containing protein [Pseudothermotoga thermarum]AEH50788.1 type IV pilus assembly PilZ [Pseudothermotoga thermarum DSM 5069]